MKTFELEDIEDNKYDFSQKIVVDVVEEVKI